MNKIQFYPLDQVEDEKIKYAVIAARWNGQWVLCRHRDRNTWELPGGHREPGETPFEAAKRELYEETGAVDADIQIVGAYRLTEYGLLCFADIRKLGMLPLGSEIGEIGFFETLPVELTYGNAHVQLFLLVQGWLNLRSNAGEFWDVLDENRVLTGRIHRRGDFLAKGDYHLVVHVWALNSQRQFLLTKRSPNKGFPNMWEAPGGSALAGDDSLTAALREMREETGFELIPENGSCVISYRGEDHFSDVWLFRQDFDLGQIALQEGETCDAMYADAEKIQQLRCDGVLVPFRYLDELLSLI